MKRSALIGACASCLTALAFVSASGCGSTPRSEPASTTAAVQAQPRASAPPCRVTRIDDKDFSVVVLDILDLGVHGIILPGNNWQVDCKPEGNRFVAASNDSGRVATITLDEGMIGPFVLADYARQQIDWIKQNLAKRPEVTFEASEPQLVGEGLYGFGFRLTLEGRPAFQVNAHKVVPSKHGLLRFHLSEIGEDQAQVNQHAAILLQAADVFGKQPDE